MKTYTWQEYYDKFYDWSLSTRIRNLSGLTSLGDADEVTEIIGELWSVSAPSPSNHLLQKANNAKLQFSGENLCDLQSLNDKALVTEAIFNSVARLTPQDVEELYNLMVSDDVIIKICQIRRFALPEGLAPEVEENLEHADCYGDCTDECYACGTDNPKKFGFFAQLFALFAVGSAFEKRRRDRDND